MSVGFLFAVAQAATTAGPAAVEGPPAATLEARLPWIDAGCIWGSNRLTGRSIDMCLMLAPHIQSLACREAADLGGSVCDYVVDYIDDVHGVIINDSVEVRSDLFARDPENPGGWRFVREIAPLRRQPRSQH
jgi:hypothetical protein